MITMIADTNSKLVLNPKGVLKSVSWWELDDLGELDLPVQKHKYVRYDSFMSSDTHREVKYLAEWMYNWFWLSLSSQSKGMKYLVDFKVTEHKAGEYGCPMSDWHIDCVTNPWHTSKPERHLIYSTHFGTEFMTEELEVLPSDNHFNDTLNRRMVRRSVPEYVIATPNTITYYERFNVHRGARILKDCKRVVLRVTETEVIR